MPDTKIVFILGDVHGDFALLNKFINKTIRLSRQMRAVADGGKLDIAILQCGDFAWFWPQFDNTGKIKNSVDFAKDGIVPIYWCGGNHEDWDRLDGLFPDGSEAARTNMVEVDKGIIFCRFGATLELAPGKNCLFAGGAESTDKMWRLMKMAEGYPKIWWDQEGISDGDLERLDNVPEAQIVVSHTAPLAFNIYPWMHGHSDNTAGLNAQQWELFGNISRDDHSRAMLDKVFLKYKPERWFFGHFHEHMKGASGGCQWECLNMAPQDGWWSSMFF